MSNTNTRKFSHRRGISQQITRISKFKQKQIIDLKQNFAFSSEHTRSTALTLYKNKQKQKSVIKDKDKKIRKQIKVQEIVWRAQQIPYTPEEVLKNYSSLLTPYERMEIRQYRNIYFIGNKIKMKQDDQWNINQPNTQAFLRYQIGGHIAYRYEILQKINRGSFGQVLRVYDHKSKQYQALKIVKKMPELIKQTFIEISILSSIKEKDKGDFSGIVRIKDFTIFRQHICISFQLLDANLYELLHANQFKGLGESFLRIFSIQILNSLNFLQKMNIVHCDIKPENFVLRSWGKSGIKLIDFGTSCYQDQQIYTYIQSRYYRAPEIMFHKYYTTAIDMWSFGCLIVELSLGKPLFPGHSDFHQLAYIINFLGYPQEQFSHQCSSQIQRIRQNRYLQRDQYGRHIKENLDRFQKDTGYKLEQESLIPLEERFSGQMFPFIHFVKQILKWDPKDRISPVQALQHPWVTSGLPNEIRQLYTIYQNLDKDISPKQNIQTKHKRRKSKSKSKSKSRQRSQQKISSLPKSATIELKKNLNSSKIQSKQKKMKFDLPYSFLTMKPKISKKNSQKSKQQKSNKSPNRRMKN